MSATAIGAAAVSASQRRRAAVRFFIIVISSWDSRSLRVFAGITDGHIDVGDRDRGSGGQGEAEKKGGSKFFHFVLGSWDSRDHFGSSQG